MNEKLTLPVLVRLMSEMSGRSRRQCEEFIRELFSVLSDTLGAGEDVKVRGIGTFRIIDVEERKSVSVATGQEFIIAGHKKVAFTPDAGLADAVNQSFAMFSPVEVADSVDDEVLSVDTPHDFDEELDLDYDAETEDCCVIEETQISGESASSENDSGNTGFSSTSLDSVEYVLEEDDTPAIIENTPDNDESEARKDEEKQSGFRRCKFCWGMLVGFVAALLLVGVAYLIKEYSAPRKQEIVVQLKEGKTNENRRKLDSLVNARADRMADSIARLRSDSLRVASVEMPTAEEVDTHPSDMKTITPVEDVITTTRYLTTVAREHYGNDAFWSYIYEENKSFLGHPDRIRPGTKIIVPPLSKYGVNPKNPDDIKKAKRKGVEIYSRYRK